MFSIETDIIIGSGHYHHTIEIVYNFIGATEPSWFAENEEIIYQTEFPQDES